MKTRKLGSLFQLKDPIVHKANVIYKGAHAKNSIL